MRTLSSSTMNFQQAELQVKNFCEADSEIDILMRLIDNLRENIDSMQNDQGKVESKLDRVCAFIERVSATMGPGMDPLNPNFREAKAEKRSTKISFSNHNNHFTATKKSIFVQQQPQSTEDSRA